MKKILFFIVTGFITVFSQPVNYSLVKSLEGIWKFRIGDNEKWAAINTDDSDWEQIYVPSSWEDEGYPGYNGYAWYRKTFILNKIPKDYNLYLRMGFIDDVDEVYLNGIKVGGSGQFPPKVKAAYNVHRDYFVDKSLIKADSENYIAVRVYDFHLEGGIVHGDVGFYINKNQMLINQDLSGTWKFKLGDREEWANPDFYDDNWNTIRVPAKWEDDGYPGYDGFAWYRKTFTINEQLKNEQLILILGRIDDVDEVYFNGVRIGRTGRMYKNMERSDFDNEYAQLRAYTIPKDYLKGYNTIAVRVYDGLIDGGIYEGPIGLITRESYLKWRELIDDKVSIFEKLFKF